MHRKNDIILVTGATGRQGGAAARHLLEGGFTVRAMTRKPDGESARILKKFGADVVYGDFDDPGSLEKALKGVWGAHSVQNSWEAGVEREAEQGKRFAELARKEGVGHFVYSSVGSAHRKTGIPHFESKWQVEEAVRGLEFPSYTIIRPVFFMENFLAEWILPGILDGKLRIGLKPDTPLQMIAVDDIGRFARFAFEDHERMNGAALDIAGDENTMVETAQILSAAIGHAIDFEETPKEEVRKGSEDFAIMFEWFDSVGYNADIPKLRKIHPMLSLGDWAERVNWPALAAS
jgi:uncharacterized protein YbjT (DUF2867 family)